jgi:hypothetical protein
VSEQQNGIESDAHAPIHLAGTAVHGLIWRYFNLRAAWPWFDPTLRLCMVQGWLHPQLTHLRRLGYDRDETVAALVADDPRHRLWSMLEAAWITQLDEGAPADIGEWVLSADAEALAPDIERLVLYQPAGPGGVSEGACTSLVMRYTEGVGWRLLSFHEDVPVPVPGWPPTM